MGSTFEDAPVPSPGPTETRLPLDGTLLSVGDWALEPIAIVGLSCRYPGGASTPSKLWANLAAGTSAWSRGPPDGRFNMAAFHDGRNPQSSTTNTDGGHFLSEDISAFDASFFGIHGVEAKAMDPQQRLLLEIAYEAFENAGLNPSQIWGSNTGVYAGQWTSDYGEVLARDPDYQETYHVTGVGPAITSNRISYHFNLLGPSMTIDTGCSASLVALHLAVQSLRAKETDRCFVGGVNILSDPQRFTYQSKLKMLSDAGRSYPFDHRAAGYGRGEGVAGVILKPLSAAVRDGDRVRAIIRNTVLNSDGRTPGITVPDGAAQERAIRKAYSEAKLELGADYVEAHGTGTAVGDPIEVEAIAAALSKGRTPSDKLPIGSIKGNIGHTESAAGLAGLIKAVLMLEKGCIPPQTNFEKANSKLLLDEWNLRVKIPLALEPRDLRRISVNSFGYGGTNAHVILDTARSLLSTDQVLLAAPRAARPRAFIVSGANDNSFRMVASGLADYVAEMAVSSADEQLLLDRLAITINRRSIHRHRTVIIAGTTRILIERLQSLAETPVQASPKHTNPRIAFIFSGQGAQYYNMGRELLDVWPVFTESLNRANGHLASLGCEWDVFCELHKGAKDSRVDEPRYGQPLSTAVQLALFNTLDALGLTPAAVAGHSSGEIAAAYAAGYLSFEDAMTVSYHRGRLASALLARILDKQGGMIAIGTPSWVAEKYIASLGSADAGKLTIACYNSPSSVTVSGDSDAIARLSDKLSADSVFNRVLRTSGAAYHSDWMRQIEREYCDAIAGVRVQRCASTGVTMYSSLTGAALDPAELDDNYWIKNLVSPVLFEDAIWTMCRREGSSVSHSEAVKGIDFILEIGPHSTLEGPVKQIIQSLDGPARNIKYVATLKRKTSATEAILTSIGRLYSEGFAIDFHLANNNFDEHLPSLLEDAPPYAFDHSQRYWHTTRISSAYIHRQSLPHELLGNLSPDAHRLEPRWRCFLDTKRVPWLLNHIIEGQIVFPAAGYLAMAVEAARRYLEMENPEAEVGNYKLHKVSFGNALVVNPEVSDTEICLSLRPEVRTARTSAGSWMDFRVFTVSSSNVWTEHCRGLVAVEPAHSGMEAPQLLHTLQSEVQLAVRESQSNVNPRKFYYRSQEIGLQWQTPFDGVVGIKLGPKTSVCTVSDLKVGQLYEDYAENYLIHPATLDAALFHGLSSILVLNHNLKSAAVPVFIQDLLISGNRKTDQSFPLTCHSIKTEEGPLTFDVASTTTSLPSEEEVVFLAYGIKMAQLPGDVQLKASSRQLVHEYQWVTYCDDMTTQGLDSICKSSLTPSSIMEEANEANAIVRQHVQHALNEVMPDVVPDGYRRIWYAWMQSLLANDQDDPFHQSHIIDTTIDGASSQGVMARAASRIGRNLAGILKGEIEPLSLLSQDDLLSSLYSDPRCERCYSQMAAYCRELSRQKPGMRVIEIGAGTGSASRPLLTALGSPEESGQLARYDFTDISPAFFEAAGATLAEFKDVLSYRVCDIGKDVALQGFEEHSYDLVVACNVVHATSSVRDSLRHIQFLLKPGGVLLLMELTKDEPYYNLIFGSLPGWWSGHEEGGKFSPLLSNKEWHEELASQGFSTLESGFKDYDEADGGTIDVFVAHANVPSAASIVLPVEVLWEPTLEPELPGLVTGLKNELGSHLVSASNFHINSSANLISVFPPEICEALADNVDPATFQRFKDRVLSAKAILFLTQGATQAVQRPAGAMIAGFARTIRLEYPATRIITLDLSLGTLPEDCYKIVADVLRSPSFDLINSYSTIETEFSSSEGQLYVPRVIPSKSADEYIRGANRISPPEMLPFFDSDRVISARLGIPGLLETIHWDDDTTQSQPLGPDEVELSLRAASVNFKDVLIAAAQLEGTTEMRNDCAGIVVSVGTNMAHRFKPGDRVCAYYSHSYCNRPRVHGDCVALIHDSLTIEEGASLPIVWGTAFYGLVDKGSLKEGESVLIHSAAGAVGQAAIILAQYLGACVYATVGSEEKKKYLVETFGIPESHIFSSRTPTFGRAIRNLTGGRGVDVVLNSLGGDVFRESCNTLAPYGRFVEIGRKEFLDDMLMPTKFLLKNITFAYIDLALLIDDKKELARRILRDVVELMASGAVRPTAITTMPISEIEAAFRLIQTGKHIGKVILTVQDEQMAKIVPRPPPTAQLSPSGTYLVVGLGGISRAIIRWLGTRGARQIVAVSRSGLINAATASLIEEMLSDGVSVAVKRCDVASLSQVQTLILSIPSLCGVIHSAMVVEDGLFNNTSHEQWTLVQGPKIAGTRNLHLCLPHSIEFFVCLSSIVAITGNPGQAAYSAACAYQDALAHFRRSQGLAAHSINLGVVTDSGFVSDEPEVAASLKRQGLGTVTTSQLLAYLDHLLSSPNTGTPQTALGLVPLDKNDKMRGGSGWMQDAKFAHLAAARPGMDNSSSTSNRGSETGFVIDATGGDVVTQVCQAVTRQLGKLLAIPVKHLHEDRSLNDYGADSLVSVELKNWIGVYLQANVPLVTLRNTSLRELAGHVVEQSRLVASSLHEEKSRTGPQS